MAPRAAVDQVRVSVASTSLMGFATLVHADVLSGSMYLYDFTNFLLVYIMGFWRYWGGWIGVNKNSAEHKTPEAVFILASVVRYPLWL
jgi:hypothetical protein